MGHLILLGMMGSGKTTVGRRLAESLEVSFADTDAMVEHRLGRSIPQIFELYGEEAFRQHETAVLASLEPEPGVLATGGGIVTRPENWEHLRRLGTTVYLDASVEVLAERLELSKRKRPLLQVDDWQDRLGALLDARRPLYQQADLTIPIFDQDIEDVVQRMLGLLHLPAPADS